MSNYIPPDQSSDNRIFASYPLPAKIDLINNKPRRESVIERQLDDKIFAQTIQEQPPQQQQIASSYTKPDMNLLEKESRLIREIEEMAKKPFNPQTVVIDRGQNVSHQQVLDNRSHLPFTFDNFTTKGVRGNIASVGAFEPERPRAPIYPIVRRTPSPHFGL